MATVSPQPELEGLRLGRKCLKNEILQQIFQEKEQLIRKKKTKCKKIEKNVLRKSEVKLKKEVKPSVVHENPFLEMPTGEAGAKSLDSMGKPVRPNIMLHPFLLLALYS